MSFRSYKEVSGADRSGLLEQVVAQRARVAERLKRIGRVVAVMSGKGGVGKSTLVLAMAETLSAQFRKNVLIIDSDSQASVSAMLLTAATMSTSSKPT